ncbi:Flavoprotein [Actinopolyspora xinjiangensis]|uniref:Flavoprotein n=1 Tax=Actinopolyspora xinjiangensis TaxID=405564 RepID=A0A1H0V759_9ACTN|nr:flavoprotein [Actinopolyspora xinjiangensis]SDP74211.1 Flavoprotein [Actinopolyspora xinjiangensis]
MSTHTLGLIGSAAGGLENIRTSLVEPAIARGWQVAVTLTPTAGTWLEDTGERERIEAATGLPCRVAPRMPRETSPHPPIDCFLVCPASANTVAKLALGLADNQALTTVCEAIGTQSVPIVVFPRINAAHARQPAWDSHISALERAGVYLLTGDEYWPLHEPRGAPAGKDLPWSKILDAVDAVSRT